MNTEQLPLPIATIAATTYTPGMTIQERFELFHRVNPWVYRSLELLVEDQLSRGVKRVGIGMLTEVLRWEHGRHTKGDPFKLNNSFRSRYVRKLVDDHPDWLDLFELRELRAA